MRKNDLNVNLGCGPSGLNGWVNFDWGILPLLSKMPVIRHLIVKFGILPLNYELEWPEIKLVNIKNRLPLNDKTVDNIYCSHVLEHFEKWEAVAILNECRRVLKNNGKIRLVLPDLEKIVKKYKNADNFCRMFFGHNKDVKTFGRLFIRGHQWMYDTESATVLLNAAGFKNILKCKCGQGKVPDLDKLDLIEHQEFSLYLEAEK